MKRRIQFMATCMVPALPVFVFAATWDIDPEHASIEFKVRHMMISNVRATATGKLNRGDIGISCSGVLDSGGAMVGDEVAVVVEVELVKQ